VSEKALWAAAFEDEPTHSASPATVFPASSAAASSHDVPSNLPAELPALAGQGALSTPADADGLTQALERWCREPAPRTVIYVPKPCRHRFARLAVLTIGRAVELTLQAARAREDAGLQEAALHAHRLAWCLPGLILRTLPDEKAEEDQANPQSIGARRLNAIRHRLR